MYAHTHARVHDRMDMNSNTLQEQRNTRTQASDICLSGSPNGMARTRMHTIATGRNRAKAETTVPTKKCRI